MSDLVFCLTYGDHSEKNSFIKELEKEYTIYMGKEFWERFTGDANFYKDLIGSASKVAKEINMKDVVDDVILELSKTIKKRFKEIKG